MTGVQTCALPISSLDYHSLMKLTKILTRDYLEDVNNMFRRMCFNVFAHNRDDHSKNFTYLYHEAENRWRLSPAYDLTYSNTYYGEHTTTVDGNGRNPGEKEILAVGVAAGMERTECKRIMNQIKDCVNRMLGDRKSTRLNSSHPLSSRMPSSA